MTKLSVALVGAVIALLAFVVARFGGTLAKKAQHPAPQQEPRAMTRAVQPEITTAAHAPSPPIHVHVHMPPMPTPSAPQPLPSPAPYSNQQAGTVLDRPDHRIYLTTGSHLMMEHPACDEMLERLDYALYVAAHRDGDPFTVGPPLDDSGRGTTALFELPPLSASDEADFVDEDGHVLPPPDGAVWLRKVGHVPQRITTGTPS